MGTAFLFPFCHMNVEKSINVCAWRYSVTYSVLWCNYLWLAITFYSYSATPLFCTALQATAIMSHCQSYSFYHSRAFFFLSKEAFLKQNATSQAMSPCHLLWQIEIWTMKCNLSHKCQESHYQGLPQHIDNNVIKTPVTILSGEHAASASLTFQTGRKGRKKRDLQSCHWMPDFNLEGSRRVIGEGWQPITESLQCHDTYPW